MIAVENRAGGLGLFLSQELHFRVEILSCTKHSLLLKYLKSEKKTVANLSLISHVVSKKEVLTIGKARRQIIWSENSSEPSEIVDDEAMFPSATSVGEIVPFQKPDSSLGRVGFEENPIRPDPITPLVCISTKNTIRSCVQDGLLKGRAYLIKLTTISTREPVGS
uniref:Uncharacterized protein n=1 Tax=Cucumis melo TaxID=3656 RepID=A0A9I9EGC3_CUCME